MILRNKETGEIVIFGEGIVDLNKIGCANVAEMIEAGWEDYEEPKQHWFMATDGRVLECNEDAYWSGEKQIGNYFETKEEAEKAVEKLKAFKRLKDKGFKFVGRSIKDLTIRYSFYNYDKSDIPQMNEDLDLLFGGEE